MLIIRPPGRKLTWLRALGSRRAAAITAILAAAARHLNPQIARTPWVTPGI